MYDVAELRLDPAKVKVQELCFSVNRADPRGPSAQKFYPLHQQRWLGGLHNYPWKTTVVGSIMTDKSDSNKYVDHRAKDVDN